MKKEPKQDQVSLTDIEQKEQQPLVLHASQTRKAPYHVERDTDYGWAITFGALNLPILFLSDKFHYFDCTALVAALNGAYYAGMAVVPKTTNAKMV